MRRSRIASSFAWILLLTATPSTLTADTEPHEERLLLRAKHDTGYYRFYSVSLDGGDSTHLGDSEGRYDCVALSPSGREVVFTNDYKLYRVGIHGGEPERLGKESIRVDHCPLSFSPDGSHLVFVFNDRQDGVRKVGLMALNVETGEGRILYSGRRDIVDVLTPFYSWDGQSVAFALEDAATYRTAVHSVPADSATPVAQPEKILDRNGLLTPSADRKYVLIQNQGQGEDAVFSGDLEMVDSFRSGFGRRVLISSTGERVAFHKPDVGPTLRTVYGDDQGQEVPLPAKGLALAFSPDGTNVLVRECPKQQDGSDDRSHCAQYSYNVYGLDGNRTDEIPGLGATFPDLRYIQWVRVADDRRFVDTGEGTVRDTATGLLWLQKVHCGFADHWEDATEWAAKLHDGCTDCDGAKSDCGLADGSLEGQWRLPTLEEVQALITPALRLGCTGPTLTDDAGTECYGEGSSAFTNADPFWYWTQTTEGPRARSVMLGDGSHKWQDKNAGIALVWPVRDP